MAEDQDCRCRFSGPDDDGDFWLHRTDTSGAFEIINLGRCPRAEFLAAMADYLARNGRGNALDDQRELANQAGHA